MRDARSLKIYVAGPYTASTSQEIEQNVERAIDAGLELLVRGHKPFIPHLTHFVELRAKDRQIDIRWTEYIEWDRAWLDTCDVLLCLGRSKGVDLELEQAANLGLPIFTEIEDLFAFANRND